MILMFFEMLLMFGKLVMMPEYSTEILLLLYLSHSHLLQQSFALTSPISHHMAMISYFRSAFSILVTVPADLPHICTPGVLPGVVECWQ